MTWYIITNQHSSCIWEGEAWSFYDAWKKMFDVTKTPKEHQSITQQIELGMWIEKRIL